MPTAALLQLLLAAAVAAAAAAASDCESSTYCIQVTAAYTCYKVIDGAACRLLRGAITPALKSNRRPT
jgi:hypothetical protein